MDDKHNRLDEEWRQLLSPEAYAVCRKKGTERPFSGKYHDCKEEGVYLCVCCGTALFHSETKFDSGTGWPSFSAPIAEENISAKSDNSDGMRRIEVLCRTCDAHLGHVFDDGPAPANQRYCVNSVALVLEKKSDQSKS